MAISALAGHHIVMGVDIVVVEVRSNRLCGLGQTIVDDRFGKHQDITRFPGDCDSTGHLQPFVVLPTEVEVAFVGAGQRDDTSILCTIIREKENDIEHTASDNTVTIRIVCSGNASMPTPLLRTTKF